MSQSFYNEDKEKVDRAMEQRERQKARKLFRQEKLEEAKKWVRRCLSDEDKWDMICQAEEKYEIGLALEAWVREEYPTFQKPSPGLLAACQKLDPEFWGGIEIPAEVDDEF